MIFTPEHCKAIVEGRKTQTRRLVKAGESPYGLYDHELAENPREIWNVLCDSGRIKWSLNKTYSVQPGRTKPGIPEGRIRITAIRRERLQDISEFDAIAEGVMPDFALPFAARLKYALVWMKIYWNQPAFWWWKNPEVWVLTFEFVPEGA